MKSNFSISPNANNELEQTGQTKFSESFLLHEAKALLDFAHGSFMDIGGFGYMDSRGRVDRSKSRESYIQSRMVQVFGLSHIIGIANFERLTEHGIKVLNSQFLDKANGGFFNSIDLLGNPVRQEKLAYDHMFVLLAATTANVAGIPGAKDLVKKSESIIKRFFWDSDFEMMNDSWDLNFTELDEYRGINSNMHAVEALTAAFDATGILLYRDWAYAICKRAIDSIARRNNWFLPEHFDSHWQEDKEFNLKSPADQFRPYGVTIGHLFEWARLILQIRMTFREGDRETQWILEAAKGLYQAAKKFGWAVDNSPGFIYTIDWNGNPVVRSRMQWVSAEAVMAAYVLWKATGDLVYLKDYNTWWSYIEDFVIDREFGSWHHELNSKQEVITDSWPGKPDIYHAFNACLLPLLPLEASFIGAAIKQRDRGRVNL